METKHGSAEPNNETQPPSQRNRQHELERANSNLAARLTEKTLAFNSEMARRTQSEHEKTVLLSVVQIQTQQVRQLTNQLLVNQLNRQAALADELDDQVVKNLVQVNEQVNKLAVETTDVQFQARLTIVSEVLNETQGLIHNIAQAIEQSPADTLSFWQNPLLSLSERERDVLLLLIANHTTAEIANTLFITESTVRTYRSRIMRKLGVQDSAAIRRIAIKHGLIDTYEM